MKVIRHSGKAGEFEEKYEAWRTQPNIQQDLEFAEYAREEYQASLFSMHVISGSILQIACKYIELYSTKTEFDEDIKYLYEGCKPRAISKLAKYAVGDKLRGVPIGLIIYSGRNQYNHIEENGELTNVVNINVFRALATNHEYGDFTDPAFDLNNDSIIAYSSNIRALLGWDNYSRFLGDMRSLFEAR